MNVRDAMVHTIRCATAQDTIEHVAELMKEEDTGFIPVIDGDDLTGVVTDRDIVIRCLAEGHSNPVVETVEHVMSRDVRTVSPDDDLETAAAMMAHAAIRRLAVVENGRLIGVLSHGNLVQASDGTGPATDATVGVTEGA
jgi:CBS domain-containing protein